MPIHEWSCQRCAADVEVIRTLAEAGDPPQAAELKVACLDTDPHLWVKVFTTAPAKVYGAGWGTRKGSH